MIQQVQSFLQYLQQERHRSLHTLNSYKIDLSIAIAFFQSQNISTWTSVEAKTLRALLAQRRLDNISARTLNRQLSSLRTFYRYLIQEKIVSENTAAQVKALKSARPLPRALDVDQMAKLLEFPSTDPLSIRDSAILEVFYSAGLRVSEMISLNIADLDLAQQQSTVLGKGKKTRLALLGRYALVALEQWLKIRSNLAKAEETAVFVSKTGRRLSARALQYRLHKIGISQGLETRLTPHRLRHSFASHLLESSNDLRSVQELLGHTNLSTTQIYTKVNFQHLATVYDQCHPRARKQNKTIEPAEGTEK